MSDAIPAPAAGALPGGEMAEKQAAEQQAAGKWTPGSDTVRPPTSVVISLAERSSM